MNRDEKNQSLPNQQPGERNNQGGTVPNPDPRANENLNQPSAAPVAPDSAGAPDGGWRRTAWVAAGAPIRRRLLPVDVARASSWSGGHEDPVVTAWDAVRHTCVESIAAWAELRR